jgi:hypothetical protein
MATTSMAISAMEMTFFIILLLLVGFVFDVLGIYPTVRILPVSCKFQNLRYVK